MFTQACYKYGIHYCDANGLTFSHDMVEIIMQYLFYGKYQSKLSHERGKYYDVVRGLHKTLTSPRRRFASKAEEAFEVFIKLLRRDPDLKRFLQDRGVGTPPIEYMAAVETGLRALGTDLYAMGSRAIDSKARWGAVQLWRKSEAYIAAGRFVLGSGPLRNWSSFKWEHYKERQSMARTFRVRHFPVSDGNDHFEGLVPEPKCWSMKKTEPKCGKTCQKCTKKKPEEAEVPAKGESKGVMIMDPDTGEFVMVKENSS